MENPIELRNKKAAGALGLLIRQWTVDPDSRPYHRTDHEGRCVMKIDDFMKALQEAAGGGADVSIRHDVEEVELILRAPKRFSILLPEQDAIRHQMQKAEGSGIRIPRLYDEFSELEPDLRDKDMKPAIEETGAANYQLTIGSDPFRKFLDPYMAAYVCTQCL